MSDGRETMDETNHAGKLGFESDLVRMAYESAKKTGDVDSSKQKKYVAIQQRIAKVSSPQPNYHSVAKGVIKKTELEWEIGFTPKNFENLVAISGAASNIEFYTTHSISKTVFYSYMRGETSPAYKDWKKLVDAVLGGDTTIEDDA